MTASPCDHLAPRHSTPYTYTPTPSHFLHRFPSFLFLPHNRIEGLRSFFIAFQETKREWPEICWCCSPSAFSRHCQRPFCARPVSCDGLCLLRHLPLWLRDRRHHVFGR
ncbi:UNVERIFIED_CONTAM: hypothetical protein Slati_1416400, partial [Sesamum latifolium]